MTISLKKLERQEEVKTYTKRITGTLLLTSCLFLVMGKDGYWQVANVGGAASKDEERNA